MTDAAHDPEFPRLEPDDAPSDAPGGWPAGKADVTKRFVAVIIDAAIAVVVGFIPFVGGLLGAAYWLLRDGMDLEFMDHRSVGKKLTGLRPVTRDGHTMTMEDSIRRNWMFALGGLIQVLLFIPILGWLMIIPVGLAALALGLVEAYKVITDEEGRRLGDGWADTKVIEVGS